MNVQSAVSTNPYIYQVSPRLNRNANGARVINYSELVAENSFQDELDSKFKSRVTGEMIDPSTLDRIDPTKMEFYTIEYEPDVELGVKYMRSCFNRTIGNVNEFYKLTAAEDFTGMSDAEIYKKIYEKYQYCYGSNFYYAAAINYPLPPSEYDDYHSVIRSFEKEVAAALGDEEKVKAARREVLYGNMSDYEVRQKIIDQYDLSDGLTFRELYKLSFDIWKAGLDGGFHNRLDDLFYDFSTAESRANCNNILTRERYLDTNVSDYYFNQLEKFYRSPGTRILPEYYTTLSQITGALGY